VYQVGHTPAVSGTSQGNKHAEAEAEMDKLLLTTTEAAAQLGVGRSTVYVLLKSGELASVRIGRSRRVPSEAVRTFVSKLQVAG
jgi:excisionase family DNA binding protein